MGSPTGAAGGERGMECSPGIAHRLCLGRGGDELQPWDRPQAPQERGEGGAQPWDHPHVQRGGGAGGEGSRRYSTGNTIYTFALVGR